MKKVLAFLAINLLFLSLDAWVFFSTKQENETRPIPAAPMPPQMPPSIEPAKQEVPAPAPEPQMSEEQAFAFLVDLIKQREGFQPRPYRCPAGVLTIGYGFTEPRHLKLKKLTEKQASEILEKEIIPAMRRTVRQVVNVPLTPYQEAALISFCFNLGEGNLQKLVNGTNRLNGGNYERTAKLMMLYTKADGKTLKGLVERRKQEAKLFLGKM
jgi:lysozyme